MKNIACTLASLLALAHAPAALAQASCNNDGIAQPVALFERFLSADCEACWQDSTTPAPSDPVATLLLDWIVPSAAGDDAPLSAAATTDALARLQTLGRNPPASTDVYTASVEGSAPAQLRVAHGPPFNDYLGTIIAFTPAGGARQPGAGPGPFSFHLLLVESVPAGTNGTAVHRNIVRNMLQGTWDKRNKLSKKKPSSWTETRSMRIPDGAQAERLHMVGWVQDAQGRMVAATRSVCR